MGTKNRKKRKSKDLFKGGSNKKKILENIEILASNPPTLLNPPKKYVDLGKFKQYSLLISNLYAPFGKLINNSDFDIFSSDYSFFESYNFEEESFSYFIEKITDFNQYWILISNIFEIETRKKFNTSYLNSFCQDLVKSVSL